MDVATPLLVTGLLAISIGSGVAIWLASRRAREFAEELAQARAAMEDLRRTSNESRAVRDVVDSAMQDGVLLFDRSSQLTYSNEVIASLLPRLPTSIAQLFPAAAAEAADAVAASGEPRVVEVEMASPPRWLRFAVSAASDGGVLVVVSDVTEARQIEAIRRDFVINASHELKTPAASIRAAAEMLLHALREDRASAARFARTLEQEAERLSRIVADLLDLSRLEGGGDLEGSVDLHSLVAEEGRRFADRAEAARLTLVVQTEPVPLVKGSERDLALMVGNLIDNAIRYTSAGGTVSVSVGSSDGEVRVRVADSGIGIPQRDLTRVLERFYRVDRGRSRRSGGTGLGLSIVRHVAENHGGSVSLQSEVGRGTTVDVVLPVRSGG